MSLNEKKIKDFKKSQVKPDFLKTILRILQKVHNLLQCNLGGHFFSPEVFLFDVSFSQEILQSCHFSVYPLYHTEIKAKC